MAKRLQEHLNSTYVELASKLRPKNAARKVVAYVESYDDVFFWRSVLQDFETDRLRFEVMLPSRRNLSKGKKAALMNRLGPSLGDYMIACVDADYDYLMQGATSCSLPPTFSTPMPMPLRITSAMLRRSTRPAS